MSNSVVTVIHIKLIALNSSVFTAESVSKIMAAGGSKTLLSYHSQTHWLGNLVKVMRYVLYYK